MRYSLGEYLGQGKNALMHAVVDSSMGLGGTGAALWVRLYGILIPTKTSGWFTQSFGRSLYFISIFVYVFLTFCLVFILLSIFAMVIQLMSRCLLMFLYQCHCTASSVWLCPWIVRSHLITYIRWATLEISMHRGHAGPTFHFHYALLFLLSFSGCLIVREPSLVTRLSLIVGQSAMQCGHISFARSQICCLKRYS